MGVNLYLLDRRTATLSIGATRHVVGTLRRFFKLTELNKERAAELEEGARIRPSPSAVVLTEISELPMARHPEKLVPCHLVLGWDDGRGSVTDLAWDYLPKLGFAVLDKKTDSFLLYEEREGLLHDLDDTRARELLLIDSNDHLIRHGQPRIERCRSITPYISGFLEADCDLEGDRHEKLLIAVRSETLPDPGWFIGKTPYQVRQYP